MNYATLLQQIQDWTEYTETSFVSHIPDFVRFAEERIYRSIYVPYQSQTGSTTCTSSVATVAAPSGFLFFDYLNLVDGTGGSHVLINKEPDYIVEAYPTAGYVARPIHYGLQTPTTLVLGPTPDSNYTLNYRYYLKPASIVDAGTSWIGDNCENLLLYGSLVQAYTYMKGEDTLMQKYEQLYQDAMGKAVDLGQVKERSDQYRQPMPRPPPIRGD